MTIIARENAPLLPFYWSPEDDDQVKFKLRGLTTNEVMEVRGLADLDMETETMRWTRRSVLAGLQAGLLGWDGFKDAAGMPVEFSKKAADNVERLGIQITMKLFGLILEATGLNKAEAKN